MGVVKVFHNFLGISVFEKPCGVVIGVRELFGSESKSQVYGHLHDIIDKEKMDNLGNFKFCQF